MNDEQKETLDRVRRIETKLTRLITGEADRGVTKVEYTLEDAGPFFKLHLRSANITVTQLTEVMSANFLEEDEVDVFENGRFLLSIKMR